MVTDIETAMRDYDGLVAQITLPDHNAANRDRRTPATSIVVNYPNTVGISGRYTLRDQRTYFSKFEGGASYVFELALRNVVDGDLLNYTDQCGSLFEKKYINYSDKCNEIFDTLYQVLFEENTTVLDEYHTERREFSRRIFDIYRFAKTGLGVLGDDLPFSSVKKLTYDKQFDSGSFLLK